MASRRAPAPATPLDVTIDHLGGQGDGIAPRPGGAPVVVPQALPGESVRLHALSAKGDVWQATHWERLSDSDERQAPRCPHFALDASGKGQTCGGCTVQHLAPAAYRAWKLDQVQRALARQGLAPEETGVPLDLWQAGERRRRRASLHAHKARNGALWLGFHQRRGERLIDLRDCAVLETGIQERLAALRALCEAVLPDGARADLLVTMTSTGLDLVLTGPAELGLAGRQAISAWAERADPAAVAWRPTGEAAPEPVVRRRTPEIAFDDLPVALPPGVFLQAVEGAEERMRALVQAALPPPPAAVADLFCGVGPFALPLARTGYRVHAADSDEGALGGLEAAARRHQLSPRLTIDRRDLFERPLRRTALKDFDAVIFDPPRAGAKAQAEALAQALAGGGSARGSGSGTSRGASRGPGRIIAVSCHAGTFARDARLLVEGGYRLTGLTVIDQFVYTGHVELVASFGR